MIQRTKLVFLTVIVCVAFIGACSQSTSTGNILNSLSPSHPRLFASKSRIAAIKNQSDFVSKQLLLFLKNDVTIEVQDVSKSKAVQDSDNPGLSRIVITTITKAGSNGRLHLNAYPGSVIKNKNQ